MDVALHCTTSKLPAAIREELVLVEPGRLFFWGTPRGIDDRLLFQDFRMLSHGR